MSSPPDVRPSGPAPDAGLPPVEPPSAGFIVQLFVVPAIIVAIIVVVWLLFNWLAQMGADPSKYVQALARNNEARWQAAASLADMLNTPRHAALKQDRQLARQLNDVLLTELQRGESDEGQATLKVFLCRALGEFEVAEAQPALLLAAAEGKSNPRVVRRAALEGLAVLASHLPAGEDAQHSELLRVLSAAASDADPQIRSAAAFALGVVGDAPAEALLEKALADIYPDVRYNAATGLARHGNPAGVRVILEMLDPSQEAAARLEADRGSQEFKHVVIMVNALQAVTALMQRPQAPELDAPERQALRAAVEALSEAKVPQEVRMKATETLRAMDAASGNSVSRRAL